MNSACAAPSTKFQARHGYVLAGAACLLLVAAFGLTSILQFQGSQTARQLLRQTNNLLRDVDDLLLAQTYSESAIRFYVLTGEQTSLAPYVANRPRLIPLDGELVTLTRDHPAEQDRLRTLEPLLRLESDLMAETVRAYRDQGPQAALTLVGSKGGVRLSERIRSVLTTVRADEQRLLTRGRQTARRDETVARLLAITGIVIAVLMLAMAGWLIERARTRSEAAETGQRLLAGQMHAAFSSISQGLAVFDPDNRLARWNNRFATLLGLPEPLMVGVPYGALVAQAPAGGQALLESADQVRLSTGRGTPTEPVIYERKLLARNLQVEVRRTSMPGGGFVLTLADITVRVAEREALKAAKERLALATDSGRIGIWDWDVVTNEVQWDDWMYRLFDVGRDRGPIDYDVWASRVHPHDRAAAEQAIRNVLERGAPLASEFRIVCSDGSIRHIQNFGQVVHDARGQPLRVVGTSADVTERHMLTAKLEEERELLRVTLLSIGDGVITTDAAGRITWLNPVAERLTGWSSLDAVGQPLETAFTIYDELTGEPVPSPAALCRANGATMGLANQTKLVAKDGTEFSIEDTAAPIWNASHQMLGIVLVFHDVSEQRRLAREMKHRATHDMLTGLLNRVEFECHLERALHRSREDGLESSLLYIDLDQFKVVNDSCGHAAGDELLIEVARLLPATVRSGDIVARFGGDEFVIMLDRCPIEQARRLADRICRLMEDFRFVRGDRRFRVGTSIGLVPIDCRWPTIAALLQAGDSACYAAKNSGRNRVHEWSETERTGQVQLGQTQWVSRLEKALDDDRFALFAQRILPLREGTHAIHAEVLLRLTQDDGSLVLPDVFLPAAERFHMASRVDRWVLRKTIAWLQTLPSLDLIKHLAVNLSGQSLVDRSFHVWAVHTLMTAGPDICARLCFEITETEAITNLAEAGSFILQLRDVGARVALDDFGAGASSFGYLKSLSADYIKIDGQFIRDLVTDPLSEAAVGCFVSVARAVSMQTVAELVDRQDVLDRLRHAGIDFAQGHLIHRPGPIDELRLGAPVHQSLLV